LSAEHSFFKSKMRAIVGFRFASMGLYTFNGNSLLQNDFISGNVLGLGRTTVSMLQAGVVYDTRDLESDPSRGVFAEVTNELSLQALGSNYNFNKVFVHAKVFQRLLPSVFKKLIFSARVGVAALNGNAPVYEYMEEWGSEGGVYDVVGGRFALRGYKQARFLANYLDFVNIELRARLTQFVLLKQHIALGAVPFFDAGGVGDKFLHLTYGTNYRYAEGLGLRIAWNVNTILRFDYAISQEDHQFFFQFGHSF